ncbi:UNVERIFIED_CONTAM: Protein HEAT INTOLERANT 4, partial [Sesamum indicum]
MRKGAKRKATHKGESQKKPPAEEQKNEPSETPSHPAEEQKNEASQSPGHPDEENHLQERSGDAEPQPSKEAAAKGRRKRAKVSKPETEPEYFPEKRNLENWVFHLNEILRIMDFLNILSDISVQEDLWEQVFPVGTEDAFEEGGELHNKKVYLFGCTEPQLVSFQGQGKVTMIPVVVADFVKEKVREAKKANRVARETRKKTLAEMSEETRAAFENMRFYKFYPVPTPDTPDVSNVK